MVSECDLGGFGDQRLRQVGLSLLCALQVQPTVGVQALAQDRAQAVQFGRFLANRVVSAGEMLAHAGRLTAQRALGRHVLAVQDTTELHFGGETARKRGFGASGTARASVCSCISCWRWTRAMAASWAWWTRRC